MQTGNLIALTEFCSRYNIDISFITSLQQTGLIETTTIEEEEFIDPGQLLQLEKIVTFYYELDINLEGIETITHLLKLINNLQDEIKVLRNRLRLYEQDL